MATRTTITIEDELLDRVRAAAQKNRRDLSAEICQMLDEAFSARSKTERRRTLREAGIGGRGGKREHE